MVAWRYKERGFPYFSRQRVTDQRVIIGGRDKRVHCLDRATGKQLWEFQTGGKVDSSPIVCGDKIAFGCEDGRIYVVSMENGKELWSYEIGKPLTASPAVVNAGDHYRLRRWRGVCLRRANQCENRQWGKHDE